MAVQIVALVTAQAVVVVARLLLDRPQAAALKMQAMVATEPRHLSLGLP